MSDDDTREMRAVADLHAELERSEAAMTPLVERVMKAAASAQRKALSYSASSRRISQPHMQAVKPPVKNPAPK